MELTITNGLCSFIGKPEEEVKIEKALELMAEHLDTDTHTMFGNVDEDEVALGISYDMKLFTVNDVKESWKVVKKEIKKTC